MRNKYDALIRLGSRDDLTWRRKPLLDVGSQISDLPKPRNILLFDRGGHPPALKVGSGHSGRSGVFELGSWVLELEMRKGARVVQKRDRHRPLYKGSDIKRPQHNRLGLT